MASVAGWGITPAFAQPRRLRALLHHPQLSIGVALLLLVAIPAFVGPLLVSLQFFTGADADMPPSAQHLMGTGTHTQDVFDQWVYAARYSLTVGLLAGISSTVLSTLIGVTAGYVGRWAGTLLDSVTNLFLFVPPFPAILVLAFAFGVVGAGPLILVVTIITWAYGAALLRSQTVALRSQEFVEAAVVAGESWWRTIWHEVLPHLRGLIVFILVSAVLFAMQSEFGLEFLGWGVGGSSGLGGGWGVMMYNAHYDDDFQAGVWWTWLFPALGIMVTSAALALIGTGVMATGDTRGRRA